MNKHVSELQHAIDSLNSADDDYDRLLDKCKKLQAKNDQQKMLIEEAWHDIEHYLLLIEEMGGDSSSARASECIDGDDCRLLAQVLGRQT